MWLFELSHHVRAGLKIDLRTTPQQITFDLDGAQRFVLPLGGSIRKLLKHPDDAQESCYLLHAHLTQHRQGPILSELPERFAPADRRALVAVTIPADLSEGERISYRPLRRPEPAILRGRLLMFTPGDAVRVIYSSRLAPGSWDLRWDGESLSVGDRRVVVQAPRLEPLLH